MTAKSPTPLADRRTDLERQIELWGASLAGEHDLEALKLQCVVGLASATVLVHALVRAGSAMSKALASAEDSANAVERWEALLTRVDAAGLLEGFRP